MDINVRILGIRELMDKLGPGLTAKPVREFMESAAIAVQSKARRQSPVDSGRLRNSIAYELEDAEVPTWARIGTNVTERGVSYPLILELSPKHHYRGTQHAGQPTRGWFTGSLAASVPGIKRLLRDLGRDLERRWRRR